MKIGIDCRLWSESGVGRYIRNLVGELSKIDRKNEYVLFCLERDRENLQFQISPSGVLRTSNFKFKIITCDIRWHSVAEQIGFPIIINRENVDLMHFTYFSVPILYRRLYVVTMHDTTVGDMATGKASTLPVPIYKAKQIAYRLIVRQALKNACKVIVPTKAVREALVKNENLLSDNIVVTPEGSGISNFQFPISNKNPNLKIQKNLLEIKNFKFEIENYFLYVGNAYPHKNLERLCEAFYKFRNSLDSLRQLADRGNDKQKDLKLALVGKEDYFYKRLKEELKEKKIDKNIVFTGFVSDFELVEFYKNAKAVFVPSLAEGFGLPAVEAMKLGTLVAVSDIPVMREICGDAVLYFNPEKTYEIVKTMSMVYENEASYLNQFIQKGIKRSKLFSWEKMAAQTLKVYESCFSI